MPLNFEKASSIGFRSGEYGVKNRTIAPTPSIMDTVSCTWCLEQLSIMTALDSIEWKKLWEQLLLHKVIEGIPISCPLDKADIKKPIN